MGTKLAKVEGKEPGLEALTQSVRKIETKVREIESQVEDCYHLLREMHEAVTGENEASWQDLYENGNDCL